VIKNHRLVYSFPASHCFYHSLTVQSDVMFALIAAVTIACNTTLR
jgi:hypothetical protein